MNDFKPKPGELGFTLPHAKHKTEDAKVILVKAQARDTILKLGVPSWEQLTALVHEDGTGCAHLLAAMVLRHALDQQEETSYCLRDRLDDIAKEL